MSMWSNFVERFMPDVADDIRDRNRTTLMQESAEAAINLLMQEGYGRAEAELAADNAGWLRQGGQNQLQAGEPTPLGRIAAINKARVYSILDPLAVVSIRTWNNYTLGTGVTFKADDDALQEKLQRFWYHKKNRRVTSIEGQHKSNRRLLVDGELFFALFPDDEAGALIRRLETTQITHIITDPEDVDVPLLYRREFSMNGKPTVWYYREWAFADEDVSTLKDPVTNMPLDIQNVQDDVVVYHIAFNSMYQRGNGLLTGALPWMAANRQFMEDRFAITAGLAKFIRKLTIKGGKAQLDKATAAVKDSMRTGMGVGPGGAPISPAEIARQTAKTFVSNENADITDMPRTTGATDARQDHRNGRLQVIAFTGLTEPYTGDAESGNLATATAMELPMLKQFQAHQQLWIDALLDIFSIVASFDDPQPVDVDVDMPPIVLDNVLQWAQAAAALLLSMPELKQPEVMREALTQLGINNVDDVMLLVEKAAQENKAFADKQRENMLNNPQPQNQPGQKPANSNNPVQESAMQQLIALLTELQESGE